MTPDDRKIVEEIFAHELAHQLHVPFVDTLNILRALERRGYKIRKEERENGGNTREA